MSEPISQLESRIRSAWENPAADVVPMREAVAAVLRALEDGTLRVAEPQGDRWHVNEWVKQAILLHFRLSPMQESAAGPMHFHDKIALQTGWPARGARVVPHAIVREGAHIASGVILMPSFVNIGAYVGAGTMIDSFATVGSCAQIGARCHISAGVVVGGVLEPLQSEPVIIGDGAFVGANSSVLEGTQVGADAVLAPGCHLTASTRIVDLPAGGTLRGRIPDRAVAVPGCWTEPGSGVGTYAVIIKKYRDASTDAKVALNEALR